MTEEQPKKMTFDEEILHYDTHPEEATPKALANFYTRLPGGSNRGNDLQQNDPRTLMEKIQAGIESHTHLYSGKRLAQNAAQFYEAIDSAVAEAGLNAEQIAERNAEITKLALESKVNEHFKAAVALNQTAIPVYQILRKQGYRHYELVK